MSETKYDNPKEKLRTLFLLALMVFSVFALIPTYNRCRTCGLHYAHWVNSGSSD